MHQHLRQFYAVRLVRRHVQEKLGRTVQSLIVERRDQRAPARSDVGRDAYEELPCLVDLQIPHEADRRSTSDAVEEDRRKRIGICLNLGITQPLELAHCLITFEMRHRADLQDPSVDHRSLPTQWWQKNKSSGSYFRFISESRG